MPQAFFVVGHAQWGKSTTLAALAGNLGPHGRTLYCDSRRFQVWHMSNDDIPERWKEIVEQLNPSEQSHVVMALCPKPDVQPLLKSLLQKKYDLFFWIIQRSHNGYPRSQGDGRVISLDEEQVLRLLGTVEVFTQLADHSARATAFENFIKTHR